MAEVWFMALLASWWSRQTHSLHSWFNCLCRCWRPYTGSKQWQRQQLNRLQDQAEHQTQVLVGVTVPPPPPLLAVTTHRMGRATTHSYSWRPPKPFQSVPVSHGRMGLPPASPGTFGDIWWDILDHLGLSQENRCRRFWGCWMTAEDQTLFVEGCPRKMADPGPVKNEIQYILDLRQSCTQLGRLSLKNVLQAQKCQQGLCNRVANFTRR